MKLKSVMFLGVTLASSLVWADYSGHYTCESVHRGKPVKVLIDLNPKDKAYHAKVNWSDATLEYDIIPTEVSDIFLINWQTTNSVGVGSWNFNDDGFTMHKMFFDLKDGKPYHKEIPCKKVK